ncbi:MULTISPECIES: HNH endonuclease [Sphingobacterium]|uniref:HNH endonuclease n=1 Tax=Sphingobacterium TaxID=28453 RepID=UPI0025801EC8|nr:MULTISPECIES: hypothetical protein [Sphingobacterium]
MKKRIKLGSQNKTFYSYVTSAMRYDAVRDKEFLPFIKQLGLRSCVYCNASYALSIHLDKNNFGKFELDHFKPQSKYPYLCTNFYNLAPCCSNCNKYKTNNDSEFFLYTTDPTTIDHFDFKLDKHSIIKYMLSQDSETLKIKFSARFHNGHDRLFKIQSTYDTLKDVAEELIWKSKIYNSSYLKSLEDGFDRKFLTGNFYRFLLGNYDRPSDIHKRPLSKMIQDIAKQLGIID